MKKMAPVILVLLALPTVVTAGEIYGKVTANGAPVGEGVTVSAKCGGKSFDAVTTDKTGTYHIVLDATGKCTLTVTQKGQSAEVAVVSYDDAAQADLVLETKDGKLAARRK